MTYRSITLYGVLSAFILGWWFTASYSPDIPPTTSLESSKLISSSVLAKLSPLKRETLHQALNGDFALISELINAWSNDAKLLAKESIPGIQPISPATNPPSLKYVTDDVGFTIDLSISRLNSPPKRFLPQTYLASTVLLALLPPEQIVALPKGLRDLPHIYPHEIIKKIPLDIDRYNSEAIYQTHPDLAFVAHYSHPSTIEALKNQEIPLFMLKHIDTIPEVLDAISRIGNVVSRPKETAILVGFIEAAMTSIDNRLRALTWNQSNELFQPTPRKILFLHYSNCFSLPTTKNLTGQLLQRMNKQTTLFSIPVKKSDSQWKSPIDQESIVLENPDGIIISCMSGHKIQKRGRNISFMKSLSCTNAFQCQNICFVDEMIQQSATQHLVLAYFDLFNSLTTMFCL